MPIADRCCNDTFLRCRLQPQPHPAKENGRPATLRHPTADRQWPVSPFVVTRVPAPPVARQRIATALPQFRPDRRMAVAMPRTGFYSGPTPRLQRLTRT